MKRFLALMALASLTACDISKKETVQVGYRGLGQELAYSQNDLDKQLAANVAPAALPPADPSSPPAAWQNVQVLNDISANEFNRTMIAMTQWVSPKESCGYCHNVANFASDEKYTKIVARRMLQMNRSINSNYKSHVQQTGVTCYSCHRGEPVPAQGLWFYTNENQYLRAYLDRQDFRVQSQTIAHTDANNTSIKQTTNSYAMMIGMSRALGVNCAYCHNTRSWSTWQNAPPSRITALYGLRMVRDINSQYLVSLQGVFPPNRLGPHGDVAKLQCSTCHQGVYKPLLGAQMAKDYPALWGSPTWERGGVSDTNSAGFRDLRGADSIPHEGTPRLPAQRAAPLPAPDPHRGLYKPAPQPQASTAGAAPLR